MLPIPKAVTHINKHVINRIIVLFAGWIPPFALIKHYGRKSGREYETPVLTFRTDNGYLFALTYGREVDWVKNLRARNYGRIEYNRIIDQIHDPLFASYKHEKERFPLIVRWFLEVLHVTDCLQVEKDGSK